MIRPVDQDNIDLGFAEGLRGCQPSEPTTDDDDLSAGHMLLADGGWRASSMFECATCDGKARFLGWGKGMWPDIPCGAAEDIDGPRFQKSFERLSLQICTLLKP